MSNTTEMTVVRRGINAFNTKLFRHWIFISIVSTIIGSLFYSLYFLVDALSQLGISQRSLLLMSYLIDGLFVGFLQWMVLHKHFNRASWWIVATGLGYLASQLLFEIVGVPLLEAFSDPSIWDVADFFAGRSAYNFVNWISFAIAIGGAQWLFLRQRLSGKIWLWIPAIFLAQLLTVLLFWIPEPTQAQPSGILDFLNPEPSGMSAVYELARTVVAGFLYGLPTGLLLSDAISNRKPKL